MLTVPKGAWASCGVIIGLDQSGIKFFLKATPLLHKTPHIHTHKLTRRPGISIRFPQLLASRGGICPAACMAALQPEACYVGTPSSSWCYHSQLFNTKVGFVLCLPTSSPNFTVPISILPSSLFLICKFWLENLANLDSTNGLYGVAVLLLAHTRYIGLSSLPWV